MTSPAAVADRLLDRIGREQGLSLLRLGDGEGVVLNRPDLRDPALQGYLTTHFGERLSQARLDDLADRLARAVRRAAVVGVRPDVGARVFPADPARLGDEERIAWVREHLPLRAEESARMDAESALRLILLGRWMAAFDWPEQALRTSAWCHFDWLESGFLADLAVRQGRIGLVTGRRALAAEFRAAGIAVDEWLVPLKFLEREPDWTPHFPDRFDELLDTLAPAFPGQVFFVGAGICGKIYCDLIAERGGIALDVGAVCDAWLGIATRPRVAWSRWGQATIPDRLLLRRQLAQRRGGNGAGEAP